MRTLSSPQLASVTNETMTLCRIVKFTLANGSTFTFTDLDVSIVIASETYAAANGFDLSAVQTDIGTATSNVTLTLLLDSLGLNRSMIEAGAMDGATAAVSLVDWSTLGTPIPLFVGEVKLITYRDELVADIELEPILSRDLMLSVDIVSSNCRYDLGDTRCTVNIAALSKSFTITQVDNAQVIETNLTDADAAFDNGVLLFTSGQNSGIGLEVQSYLHTLGTITLKLIAPFPLAIGDTGTIYPGCDKTLIGGCAKYANQLNFGGEPFVPDAQVVQPTPASSTGTGTGASAGNSVVVSVSQDTVIPPATTNFYLA